MAAYLDGKDVVVVGGGPAGMVAAAQLANHGAHVKIYERLADKQGASLTTWPISISNRALTALRHVGMDVENDDQSSNKDQLARALGLGVSTPDGSFTFTRNPTITHMTDRSNLTHVTTQQALKLHPNKIDAHYDMELIGGDLSTRVVTFKNTQTQVEVEERYDLLIGADGSNSGVRQLMADQISGFSVDKQYHFMSIMGARFPHLDPEKGETSELGKHFRLIEPRPDGTSWVSKGRSFTPLIPAPGGIATMGMFFDLNGDCACTFALPATKWKEHLTADDFDRIITSSFPQLPADCRAKLAKAAASEDRVLRTPATIKCSALCAPSVLLVGDAAHAVTPSVGIGAQAAIEDCIALGEAIERVRELHALKPFR